MKHGVITENLKNVPDEKRTSVELHKTDIKSEKSRDFRNKISGQYLNLSRSYIMLIN